MADRLEGLGHDAVIGRHDDDGDVGDLRAAGPHRRERLVARRVEEDDAPAVLGDLARADVLGDAAPLAGRDLVVRMASRRLVLPWSTWPMTVTIGARGCSSVGVVLLEEVLLRRLVGLAVALARRRLAAPGGLAASATS